MLEAQIYVHKNIQKVSAREEKVGRKKKLAATDTFFVCETSYKTSMIRANSPGLAKVIEGHRRKTRKSRTW